MNFVCSLDSAIYEVLSQEDPELGVYWEVNSPFKNIPSVSNEVMVANEFFRIKLGLLPFDTTEARTYLDNDMSKNEWLRNFKHKLVPLLQNLKGSK